ncbi:MAG: hypothetical protein IIZ39_10930, partial [Blautia sp.]|nr:hypothetical protein [Blautia sp.]
EQKKEVLHTYLSHASFSGEDDAKQLYEYWEKAYPGRAFTVEDAAYLWFGDRKADEETLKRFMEDLLSTKYFERHPRRMHLIRTATIEEIQEAEKKSQVNAQMVEAILRPALEGIPIKKIGYFLDKKEAVLTVDFPDALPMDVVWGAGELLVKKTGWTLSVKPTMNFTAASGILRQLFGTRLLSESYFAERKLYQISLAGEDKDDEKNRRRFEKATGWRLTTGKEVVDPDDDDLFGFGEEEDAKDDFFYPSSSGEMEQNAAMAKIREIVVPAETGLSRVSLRSDGMGRYFELSFISPAQGEKFAPRLRKAAAATGYRLLISQNVDQNALMGIAGELCAKFGLVQAKNPSYLPAQKQICLRLQSGVTPPEELIEEFKERTGISLTWK